MAVALVLMRRTQLPFLSCPSRWRACRLCRGASAEAGEQPAARSHPGAIVTDLVAVDDEPTVLRALSTRAATVASELGAAVVLAVTSRPSQRNALVSAGFLSPDFPLLGRPLTRRSPQYMWVPKGPGAHISAGTIALNFADSDVDLLL